MSGDFKASGSSDFSRVIILRDASQGTNEGAQELGDFNETVFAFVNRTDEDGLPIETVHAHPQPRNFHLLEHPGALGSFGMKDRRIDFALIVDHGNEFAGWRLDDRKESPFLDDWFGDGKSINGSTRMVDYRDPKGRTANLAQPFRITDDHLQQYTAAINLRRLVGNHEVAAAGYMYDRDKDYNGLLDTFFDTNNADAYGKGREGTPWGILSQRQDSHIEWPGVAHGRNKYVAKDCSKYEESPALGGGEGIVDGPLGEPKVHLYKAGSLYDPTVANSDSELGKESAQWRSVYHCIDMPERPPPPPPPGQPGRPEIPPPPGQPGPNDGGNGGGGSGGGDPGGTPPPGGGDGRIICLPYSHSPPSTDGLVHETHGYIGITWNGDHPELWIGDGGGKTATGLDGGAKTDEEKFFGNDQTEFGKVGEGTQVDDEFQKFFGEDAKNEFGTVGQGAFGDDAGKFFGNDQSDFGSIGRGALGSAADGSSPTGTIEKGWNRVVVVPRATPAGQFPITDGEGGVAFVPFFGGMRSLTDGLISVMSEALAEASPGEVKDGFGIFTDEDRDTHGTIEYRVSGITFDTLAEFDVGDRFVTKPEGTDNGLVPVSTTDGVVWAAADATAGTPPGYIDGFNLEQDATYPSIINVTGSIARDEDDGYDIEPTTPAAVDYLTPGGLNANDAVLVPGITAEASTDTWSAVTFGKFVSTADIRPFMPSRTLTGTFAVAARDGTSELQQITGTGSKLLSEVAPGDLIGNGGLSGIGYTRVVKVDSDTVCWVVQNFGIGVGSGGMGIRGPTSTYSGQTFQCFENVCVQVGDPPSAPISEMTNDGRACFSPSLFNGGVSPVSGLDVVIGQPAAQTVWTKPVRMTPSGFDNVSSQWIYLWALRKADGTATLTWSTQRTVPLEPDELDGYTIRRLVGVLPLDRDNFVPPFRFTNLGKARRYEFDWHGGGVYDPYVLVSSSGSAAWARGRADLVMPPVAKLLIAKIYIAPTAGYAIEYFRPASIIGASSSVGGPTFIDSIDDSTSSDALEIATDDAQAIEYGGTNGTIGLLVNGRGYVHAP